MGRVYASRPFEVLSMDFPKLDQSKHGYQKVLVVMDVFTKYAFGRQHFQCFQHTTQTSL